MAEAALAASGEGGVPPQWRREPRQGDDYRGSYDGGYGASMDAADSRQQDSRRVGTGTEAALGAALGAAEARARSLSAVSSNVAGQFRQASSPRTIGGPPGYLGVQLFEAATGLVAVATATAAMEVAKLALGVARRASRLPSDGLPPDNRRYPIEDESYFAGLGATAGLVANPIVLLSLYSVASTGSGLPAGPFGLVGTMESLSFVVVAAILVSKAQAGGGRSSGPLGLSELSESLSSFSLSAGLVVFFLKQIGTVGDPAVAQVDVAKLAEPILKELHAFPDVMHDLAGKLIDVLLPLSDVAGKM